MNAIMAWLTGLLAAIVPGFGAAPPPSFTGYAEADYVYVAAASPGVIDALLVAEGQQVARGAVLFRQTTDQQQALYAAARAQADAAEANWQNLTTGGRAEELAAAQAAVNKARADLTLAQATFARSQKLFASSTITQAQLDQDNRAVQAAQAALSQAEAQLGVTALPARGEQQQAALASYTAARANADKAAADLRDRTVAAPVAGRVERTYFDAGEMAPAGTPVVSILPAGALKARFYVGESERMLLAPGKTVAVSCDGCPAGLTGTVSFLASDPQYTAPIIYSREERRQLTYLAEARLAPGSGVQPGQPVTVSLAP